MPTVTLSVLDAMKLRECITTSLNAYTFEDNERIAVDLDDAFFALLHVAFTAATSNNANDIAPVTAYLSCQTPVGPSRCLHPGSHHAEIVGACNHPGCACNAFVPDVNIPKRCVSVETVLGYVRRIAGLKDATWELETDLDALRRAWIPAGAPVSDWHAMLGRAFPVLVEAFEEHPPL